MYLWEDVVQITYTLWEASAIVVWDVHGCIHICVQLMVRIVIAQYLQWFRTALQAGVKFMLLACVVVTITRDHIHIHMYVYGYTSSLIHTVMSASFLTTDEIRKRMCLLTRLYGMLCEGGMSWWSACANLINSVSTTLHARTYEKIWYRSCTCTFHGRLLPL